MFTKITAAFVSLTIGLALVACSTTPTETTDSRDVRPFPGKNSEARSKLKPGIYDLDDGTVQAIGTLEYVDLEGGFWAVTRAATDRKEGRVVAVIANGASLLDVIEPLAGQMVIVTGTRLDGVSIRMAGPEIEAESIMALNETP